MTQLTRVKIKFEEIQTKTEVQNIKIISNKGN